MARTPENPLNSPGDFHRTPEQMKLEGQRRLGKYFYDWIQEILQNEACKEVLRTKTATFYNYHNNEGNLCTIAMSNDSSRAIRFSYLWGVEKPLEAVPEKTNYDYREYYHILPSGEIDAVRRKVNHFGIGEFIQEERHFEPHSEDLLNKINTLFKPAKKVEIEDRFPHHPDMARISGWERPVG